MCGRFALDLPPLKLAEHFNLVEEADYALSWNIAPSSRICSITADEQDHRHARLMQWGLIPSWAKDASIGNKLINARGETVAEKPSFRSAFKSRRCIIPASGFFEWKTENGVKQPYYISFKSGEPMAFAGLWSKWNDTDSCCIITTSANSLMEPIHERMPVILNVGQWETWLSLGVNQSDLLLPMIHPHDAEVMQAWPVGRDLNRAGLRNDSGLVVPV